MLDDTQRTTDTTEETQKTAETESTAETKENYTTQLKLFLWWTKKQCQFPPFLRELCLAGIPVLLVIGELWCLLSLNLCRIINDTFSLPRARDPQVDKGRPCSFYCVS